MKQYQVYSIDEDGRIVSERKIEADSDDNAVYEARAMQRPLNTEVWNADRRIARIPPSRPMRTAFQLTSAFNAA